MNFTKGRRHKKIRENLGNIQLDFTPHPRVFKFFEFYKSDQIETKFIDWN